MSSIFLGQWWQALKDPVNWVGTGFTTLDEYMMNLAGLQAKARDGSLDPSEEQQYVKSYEGWYLALVKVNNLFADQFASLTADEKKLFLQMQAQEGQLKFLVDSLKEGRLTAATVEHGATS